MSKKKLNIKNKKPKVNDEEWSIQKSTALYGINNWGANYFSINDQGNIDVHPERPHNENSASADLYEIVDGLLERGLRLPILVRFPDIVNSRIKLLADCFNNAIKEYRYGGHYRGVYPIKVNQQRHLVDEIVQGGLESHLGLECGSKPELLICLSLMNNPNALIICNGFKDYKYIETALLSLKLGKNTIIVVDRMAEIQLIIDAAEKLNIKPRIGFRCRLNKRATGRWAETAGARAKFGLTPSEMVKAIDTLRENDLLDSLELLHFHMGSQIPSIQSVKTSIREGARFYSELKVLASNLKYIDVGGGLGVDYDGSGKSDSSTNYHEQEYANDVVGIIQEVCDEKNIEHPNIVTESGRSLVAHSTALVFNVLGKSSAKVDEESIFTSPKDSPVVKDLKDILDHLSVDNVNESYNDLIEKRRDTLQMFTYGVLDIEQRAKAEDLYWAAAAKIVDITRDNKDYEDIFYSLEKELSDTYYCN
ncbi:MAG: biosynthetic arginine decarboxylase, partial [Bdellovibrionales bacterium]|nr:biosynthetic arginine decarboxylase [Bdellovibrionales bacterium]